MKLIVKTGMAGFMAVCVSLFIAQTSNVKADGLHIYIGDPYHSPLFAVPHVVFSVIPHAVVDGHRHVSKRIYRRSSRVKYNRWSGGWYTHCARKYRSFNPRTGKYLAYSGKWRWCK
ncbi:MAG: BA14K family protein [Cohaesibacteraceae bacterium]|nr:BA14K family protein [Cohaesibacteraceae bacterium]MBL4877244.1 BA14K family protein [Cohaesibacteraceae bacterium]